LVSGYILETIAFINIFAEDTKVDRYEVGSDGARTTRKNCQRLLDTNETYEIIDIYYIAWYYKLVY